jgi:hypothetical protein
VHSKAHEATEKDVRNARDKAVQTNDAETLPKMLPGTVCVQWVRCGRANCRCARGELHGPYHYRIWREDGKIRKTYVGPAELGQVRAQCATRRRDHKELQAWWEEWRQMVTVVREVQKT